MVPRTHLPSSDVRTRGVSSLHLFLQRASLSPPFFQAQIREEGKSYDGKPKERNEDTKREQENTRKRREERHEGRNVADLDASSRRERRKKYYEKPTEGNKDRETYRREERLERERREESMCRSSYNGREGERERG